MGKHLQKEHMNQFYLPVINQGLYDAAYAKLSSLTPQEPSGQPFGIEYTMAFLELLNNGGPIRNFWFDGLSTAAPEVFQLNLDGDFRNFLPNQEFVDAIAASVEINYPQNIEGWIAELIGNSLGTWNMGFNI